MGHLEFADALDLASKESVLGSGKTLRPHQHDALSATAKHLKDHNTIGYFEHPTGTGKTVLFSVKIRAYLQAHASPGFNETIIVVVPKINLIEQTIKSIRAELNPSQDSLSKKCGLQEAEKIKIRGYSSKESSGHQKDTKAFLGKKPMIMVITYDSLINIFDQDDKLLAHVKFVIVDEAHNTAGKSKSVIQEFHAQKKIVLAFTATPVEESKREQRTSTASIYKFCIHKLPLGEAILKKYLTPHVEIINVPIFDLKLQNKNQAVDANALSEEDIENALSNNENIAKLVAYLYGSLRHETHQQNVVGKQGIFFTSSIKMAETGSAKVNALLATHPIVKAMLTSGRVTRIAECVHSGKSSEENEAIIQRYREGKTLILFGPNMLTEGVDLPNTAVLFNLFPSKSRQVVTQRLGRGLRASDKPGLVLVQLFYPTLHDTKKYIRTEFDILPDTNESLRFGEPNSQATPEPQVDLDAFNTWQNESVGAVLSHRIYRVKGTQKFVDFTPKGPYEALSHAEAEQRKVNDSDLRSPRFLSGVQSIQISELADFDDTYMQLSSMMDELYELSRQNKPEFVKKELHQQLESIIAQIKTLYSHLPNTPEGKAAKSRLNELWTTKVSNVYITLVGFSSWNSKVNSLTGVSLPFADSKKSSKGKERETNVFDEQNNLEVHIGKMKKALANLKGQMGFYKAQTDVVAAPMFAGMLPTEWNGDDVFEEEILNSNDFPRNPIMALTINTTTEPAHLHEATAPISEESLGLSALHIESADSASHEQASPTNEDLEQFIKLLKEKNTTPTGANTILTLLQLFDRVKTHKDFKIQKLFEHALKTQNRALIEKFIEAGVNLYHVNSSTKSTPMTFCASRGYLESLQTLLDHDVDPNAKGEILGATPLSCAAKNLNVAVVDRLLKMPGILIDATDESGYTALMHVTEKGMQYGESRAAQLQIVAMLMAAKANPDFSNGSGQSAYGLANKKAMDIELSKLLKPSNAPEAMVSTSSSDEVVLPEQNPSEPLMDSSKPIVKKTKRKAIQAESAEELGDAPLAFLESNVSEARVSKKSKVEMSSEEKDQQYIDTAFNQLFSVVEVNNSKPESQTGISQWQMKKFLDAVRSNNVQHLNNFFAHNVIDVNCRIDSDGNTALHLCAKLHLSFSIRYLLGERQAQRYIKNGLGLSPLMIAAEELSVAAVSALVNTNHGANPYSVNELNYRHTSEQSALRMAICSGSLRQASNALQSKKSIIMSLLRAGAEVTQADLFYAKEVDEDIYMMLYNAFRASQGSAQPIVNPALQFHRMMASSGTLTSTSTAQTLNDFIATHNIDVNATESDGIPPLIKFARNKNALFVRAVLIHGANLFAVDGEGNTALMIAASQGDLATFQALIHSRHTADIVGVKNIHNQNVLICALLYANQFGTHRNMQILHDLFNTDINLLEDDVSGQCAIDYLFLLEQGPFALNLLQRAYNKLSSQALWVIHRQNPKYLNILAALETQIGHRTQVLATRSGYNTIRPQPVPVAQYAPSQVSAHYPQQNISPLPMTAIPLDNSFQMDPVQARSQFTRWPADQSSPANPLPGLFGHPQYRPASQRPPTQTGTSGARPQQPNQSHYTNRYNGGY